MYRQRNGNTSKKRAMPTERFIYYWKICFAVLRMLVASLPACLSVKIQNRGPEQEIPAVTCVRLIAQETSILAPWIVRYSTDIGK